VHTVVPIRRSVHLRLRPALLSATHHLVPCLAAVCAAAPQLTESSAWMSGIAFTKILNTRVIIYKDNGFSYSTYRLTRTGVIHNFIPCTHPSEDTASGDPLDVRGRRPPPVHRRPSPVQGCPGGRRPSRGTPLDTPGHPWTPLDGVWTP